MKVFRHKTHTAYEIRKWSVNKKGVLIIRKTGDRYNLKTLMHFWKFRVNRGKTNWFMTIRTPIFIVIKHNGSLEIGHPNYYLWIIW